MLASSAEDRTVRLWKLDTLTPQATIPPQADWVQALAFTPMAAGWRSGFTTGSSPCGIRPLARWRRCSASPRLSSRPRLPSLCGMPRSILPCRAGRSGAAAVRVTLSGQGVGHATAMIIPEPGLSATIVPAARARR